MCGIFGHTGSRNSFEKCLEGLKFLQYRGYDSTGIAGDENGDLICVKEKGSISDLKRALGNKIHQFQSSIGHTRWATHGPASKHNAHPHLDAKKEVALVHNGIIENYRSLRCMLEETGVKFSSDTDSEVIAQLVAHFYRGNFIKAVRKTTSVLKGFWGLAILHKNHPGQIIATRCENPIIIGVSHKDQEAFVSSDPHAFQNQQLDLYFPKNHQIALIENAQVKIYDIDDQEIATSPEELDLGKMEISKGEYEHYMLKEIMEQPTSLSSSVHGRFLLKQGDASFEDFSISQLELENLDEVLVLGCGTSWHAGLIAAKQIEEIAKIPARAEIASEYRYQIGRASKKVLAIVLSQSGETFDTIAAMRKAKIEGAHILAVCNVPGSTLMRESDSTLLLRAGPEISTCSTKAFTSQLAALSLIALKLARMGEMTKEKGREYLSQILSLPREVERVFKEHRAIQSIAREVGSKKCFLFLGRQYMFPTCLEAALKLKEISYTHATGYPAGELKHGPIALVDEQSAVFALMGNEATYGKMLSNLEEVKARGGFIVAFAPEGASQVEQIANRVIYLPKLMDSLSTFPYAVATQLLAYEIASILGTEIDKPRNLAKSVTVE